MINHRCPECQRSNSLWRGVTVPGWQSVNDQLEPEPIGYPDRDVEWFNAEPDGIYGCAECGWEGRKQDLERVDNEGELLPEIHPQQARLEV